VRSHHPEGDEDTPDSEGDEEDNEKDGKEESKKKEDEKLSEAEIIEKTKQLAEKRKQKFNLEEGVKAIDMLAEQITNEHKIDRAKFTSQIIVLDQEIAILESQLKVSASTASPATKILITAALAATFFVPAIAQAAKQT